MSTPKPTVLLSHHLKALRLPVFLREYEKIGLFCASGSRGQLLVPSSHTTGRTVPYHGGSP